MHEAEIAPQNLFFTIGDAMKRLLPRLNSEMDRKMPLWPPDIFALCASVLQLSGAYSLIIHEDHAPVEPWERQKHMRMIADEWELAIQDWVERDLKTNSNSPCLLSAEICDGSPALIELQGWWDLLMRHFDLALEDLLRIPRDRTAADSLEPRSDISADELHAIMNAMFGLLSASDEISSCLDAAYTPKDDSGKRDFSYAHRAWRQLTRNTRIEGRGQRASLCRDIHPSRAMVLPKVHTPRNGLTIRNLSNYLAYLRVADVKLTWFQVNPGKYSGSVTLDEHVNLLVVPWPDHVSPRQFRSIGSIPLSKEESGAKMPQYGLFAYDMGDGPPTQHLDMLLAQARNHVGQIDGLVFPETALNWNEYRVVKNNFFRPDGHERNKFIVAGVGTSPPGPGKRTAQFPKDKLRAGANEAIIEFALREEDVRSTGDDQVGSFTVQHVQSKHHRWKLDKSQIVQYGLGSQLHPNVQWWEFIRTKERSIAFIELRPWLTTSVLICEDLARPDPLGDALRAIGPNLIISLLCDGPQLQGRWPGRYATALADDPGSSVLTVTSVGMANLSTPRNSSEPKSQCIALWKDAMTGVREISLPANANAVILTLSPDYMPENSADGRRRNETARSAFPILTGVLPISLPPQHSRQ